MIRSLNPPSADRSISTLVATTSSSGLLSSSDKVKLNEYVQFSDTSLIIENLPFGGLIGNASNTVDSVYSISISQTTANQNLMLPPPSISSNIRYLLITNIGTATFTMLNFEIIPGASNMFIWNSSNWILLSATNQVQGNKFNLINVNNNYIIEDWNKIITISPNGISPIIVLPPTSIVSQGALIVLTRTSLGNESITINSHPSNPLNIIPYNTNSIVNQLKNTNDSILIMSTLSGPVVVSTNINNPAFGGATNLNSGSPGYVPTPTAGQNNLFLKGNGSWEAPLLEILQINNVNSFNLAANKQYHINTILNSTSLYLPITFTTGNMIRLIDITNTWKINPITVIPPNNTTINGLSDPLVLNGGTIYDFYYDYGKTNWSFRNTDSLINMGLWNASINVPNIINGVGINGSYYKVSMSGNTNIDGINIWNVNDWIIFNGTNWDRIECPQVKTVNGHIGNVTLTRNDIGLGNVDNTADINKPISNNVQNALDNKLDYPIATFLNQVSAPTIPNLGYTKLYSKQDNNLYYLDSLGNETNLSYIHPNLLLTLNDININNVTHNDILQYDSVSLKWLNKQPSIKYISFAYDEVVSIINSDLTLGSSNYNTGIIYNNGIFTLKVNKSYTINFTAEIVMDVNGGEVTYELVSDQNNSLNIKNRVNIIPSGSSNLSFSTIYKPIGNDINVKVRCTNLIGTPNPNLIRNAIINITEL